jgi:hypothetical protein
MITKPDFCANDTDEKHWKPGLLPPCPTSSVLRRFDDSPAESPENGVSFEVSNSDLRTNHFIAAFPIRKAGRIHQNV